MPTCLQCSSAFDVTKDDLAFYEKVSPVIAGKRHELPPPTLCPQCRWRRRLMFRNERNLYHRKCDLSGRAMISMHPADSPFPVYHITEWLSDKWDPKSYGRDFDFSRPFAVQFEGLCNRIPHFSAFVDPHMDVNSEYTNCSSEAKNCYMITQAEKNEDCYYARGINTCKSCCDCLRVHRCELCYECISTRNCYHCLFCEDCDNCSDCLFSTDLRGCRNCFGCHGLVQKKYHIFNEPVSKEEWNEKVGSLTLFHAVIRDMKARSAQTRLKVPQRALHILQCENVTGDDLMECRNSRACFDCNKLEDCAYCCELASGARDCMDFSMWGINCELLYECNGCGYDVQRVLFSNHCWNGVSNLLYCESCFPSVRDCFGCFGLRHAQYCILNKQYTKEEYEELVPKIIEHMRNDGGGPAPNPSVGGASGSWGEFFPAQISPYAYNESLANEFFPLTKEQALAKGWQWRDEEQQKESYLGPDIAAPDTIAQAEDNICEKILRCEATQRPYRITAQELKFYRQLGIPPPRICPQQRHAERMTARRPRRLWNRECAKCSKPIQTTYATDRPEKVYCEPCYLSTVY